MRYGRKPIRPLILTRRHIQTSEYVVGVHFDVLKQASHPQVTYLDKGSTKHAFIYPETESEEILEVTQRVVICVIDSNRSYWSPPYSLP